MVMKFSCKLCCKPVANSHHATHCGNFNTWVHVQCNRINKQAYTFLQKSSAAWSCIVLTLSRRRSLSYRNQTIELQWNSMDWFLYAKDHRHKKVKCPQQYFHFQTSQMKNILKQIKWKTKLKVFTKHWTLKWWQQSNMNLMKLPS